MQPTLCSRCKKNVAVIFITRLEGGQTKNEGLCLKCARELHIKPVDDVINKMGLSDDELDGLTNEMMEALGNADGLMDIENSDADTDDEGKTATFPFLNRLFGGMGGPEAGGERPRRRAHARPERPRAGERPVPDRPPAGAAAAQEEVSG